MALDPAELAGVFENDLEFLDRDGLVQEIAGAGADGVQGAVFLALAGEDDDLREAIQGEHFGQGGEPLVRRVGPRGKAQIQEDYRRLVFREALERARPV